jgi:hypothetical protein
MDEIEAKPDEVERSRTSRDYLWFAVALLCIMALLVAQTHGG